MKSISRVRLSPVFLLLCLLGLVSGALLLTQAATSGPPPHAATKGPPPHASTTGPPPHSAAYDKKNPTPPALQPGEFEIVGDIANVDSFGRLVLSVDSAAIQALTWHELDITFQSGANVQSRRVRGPRLFDVLNLAAPKFDNAIQPNHRLRFVVTPYAVDPGPIHYGSSVGWGEIDPFFTNLNLPNQGAILAFEQDSGANACLTNPAAGPSAGNPPVAPGACTLVALAQPRSIGFGDLRGGRYVSGVVKIVVKEVTP